MGLDVARIDELGTVETKMSDTQNVLLTLAVNRWPLLSETVCLRFIDAYGDTIFNQAQIPVLLAELRRFSAEHASPPEKAQIERACELIASAVGQIHTYIEFIGD